MIKLLNFNKVLCLSPHPDDVEYGMAGTIMKYKDTHFDIVTMSPGGNFDKTTNPKRYKEVERVWKEAGVNNISLSYLSDIPVANYNQDELINIIESKYTNNENYDAIFVPTEIDSHFEHKITNSIASPLTRVKDLSILEYRTPSTLDQWHPNMFIDITELFNKKVEILKTFITQLHRWYFQEELMKHFHSNYQSFKKGYQYVEQFNIIQLYRL